MIKKNKLLNNYKSNTSDSKYNMERKVNSLSVMCTYACQFRCRYCEIKQFNKHISLHIINRTVELLLTADSNKPVLKFFGGEPLLKWDLIKQAMQFAKRKADKKGKKIKFVIVTNGLLLDKQKIRFLKRYPVEIIFSLDGKKDTVNKNRYLNNGKKAYGKLLTNLKFLIESKLNYFVNIVVTPITLNKLFENLLFLRELKVKKVQLCYQNGIKWPRKEIDFLFSCLVKFITGNKDSNFLMNFFNECEPTILSQEIIVDTDGKLYYDAAIFLEKKFPDLKKYYFLGRVDGVSAINSLYRSKTELYCLFKDSCSPSKKIIFFNNINLGLKIKTFLNIFSQKIINSNEDMKLIAVLKGDLFLQKQLLKNFILKSIFFLYIDGPCLNNCVFCRQKHDRCMDVFIADVRLRDNLIIKGRKLCIVGNDPLLHPEIIKIVAMAKSYGFNEIEVMTSGESLSRKKFAEDVIRSGVTCFSLPLFSGEYKMHDFIIGKSGGYHKTIRGIKNALSLGGKVFVHSNLINFNLKDLNNLENFVKNKLKLPFVILPIRPKDSILPYSRLAPSFAAMIKELRVSSLLGFPLCVTSKIQDEFLSDGRQISDSQKLYFLNQSFYKITICKRCNYLDKCAGLFKEYLYFYPLTAIKPIKNIQVA